VLHATVLPLLSVHPSGFPVKLRLYRPAVVQLEEGAAGKASESQIDGEGVSVCSVVGVEYDGDVISLDYGNV